MAILLNIVLLNLVETVLQNTKASLDMSEITDAQGTALTENYHSPVAEHDRKRRHNPYDWNKTRDMSKKY